MNVKEISRAVFIALVISALSSHADYTLTVATADADKGSVTAAGGTYPEGTAVTITATPESGYTFTRWDGVVPSLRLDNPLVLPVTNDTAVTAVFGVTHYVATTGNDSTADGTDPSTPYKTIEKAYAAAADGDTVSVGPGTFVGTAALTLSKAVVLRGAGMSRTIRSGQRTTLDNANLIVADMRFTGYGSGGAVTFSANGGTLLRSDVSGNTRTSTNGTGVNCARGNIVECVITNNVNNGGGRGVGINITGGPTLVENCLIADNTTGTGGTCGGLGAGYDSSQPLIIRHCTIVRNTGGDSGGCGGIYIGQNIFPLVVEGCLIGGNARCYDESATITADAFLRLASSKSGYPVGYRVFRDTVIDHMPTPNCPAYFTFENCVTNVPGGFTDLRGGDFTITRRSPAWGLCADGSDAGYFQSPRDGSFDVGCYPLTNSVCGRLETVLVAKAENAPDATVAFEWDLDGDGIFEASGETVPALYDEPGLHSVTVRATSGGESVTRTIPNLIYVAPREIFAWPDSPSPTFPYATWETAAHTPNAAVAAAEDGCKVQLTNKFFQLPAGVRVFRGIEISGTGPESSTVRGISAASGFVPFRLFRSGILLHSMAIETGYNGVVRLYANAIVSNCVIRSGQFTSGSGVGVSASEGLVTHCVISNNYTNNKGNGGTVYLSAGGATLRNSLVCNNTHSKASASDPTKGTVYAAAGCTVENCTIVGNQATLGAGIYTYGAAIVRNNIVWGNTANTDSSGHPDWFDETNTGLYSNNCMAEPHGENAETRDPAFIYVDGRNTYTFAAGSPCVNSGLEMPWMANASDLFGNARIQGAGPDIGCFEADMSQMTCDATADPASAFGETNVVLSAVIVGGTLAGDVAYFWDLDGDGVADASGAVVTNRFAEGRYSVTLTVTVDGETRFTVPKPDIITLYPHTIYVATDCAASAFPYNTREIAATNIIDAINCAQDGAEIRVMAGVHQAKAQLNIGRAITIRPDEGLATRPTIRKAEVFDTFVSMGNPQALVEGIVFDNSYRNPRVLQVVSGTVRDCVLSNGWFTTGSGVGLLTTGGLIDRCIVVGTSANDDTSTGRGLAAYIDGNGVVRNSLFYNNVIRSGSKTGIVYVTGKGRFENCTVVSNTCGAYPAIYCENTSAGATVVNSIAWGNYFKTTPAATYPGGADWFVAPSASSIAWSNNCAAVAYQAGDGTVDDDPLFRDPARRDYMLRRKSPARDRGVWRDWMNGSLDLLGNPRIRGVRPDVGCAEVIGQDPLILLAR